METEQKIAQITSGMQFERRKPLPRAQRDAFAALHAEISDVQKQINALKLRLWHTLEKRDYHSLSLEEARAVMGEIALRLDVISRG